MTPEGIDWKLVFVALTLLSNLAFLPYLRDIFRKRTQPHVYTWLIWVITQGTATAAMWYGGGGLAALGLTLGVLFVAFVFLLSFKYGTKNITRGDTITLIAAFAGILVWWGLGEPVISVLMMSAIDALGYIPTFRKSYEEPWSETIASWGIFAVGNIFAFAALDAVNFLTVPYIATIGTANALLTIFLLVRRRNVPKPH